MPTSIARTHFGTPCLSLLMSASEWPRCSCARRSRVDDTISGLAADHSGHAHPPACDPPAPSVSPRQVPCRRRALCAVQRSSQSRVPWCYPGSLTGFPRRPTATTRSEAEPRKRTAHWPPTSAAARTRPPRPPRPQGAGPLPPTQRPPQTSEFSPSIKVALFILGSSLGGVGPVRGLRGGGRGGWCEEWARSC